MFFIVPYINSHFLSLKNIKKCEFVISENIKKINICRSENVLQQ